MKLESLQLDKFQNKVLKKEQMFKLNGGVGIETAGGTICGPHGPNGQWVMFDYGFDSYRPELGYNTYHNRTNIREVCMQP